MRDMLKGKMIKTFRGERRTKRGKSFLGIQQTCYHPSGFIAAKISA
jgi:hypothetical protein